MQEQAGLTHCLSRRAQIVDAVFSQFAWEEDGKNLKNTKQKLSIAAARTAYNQLALTCKNPRIVELYGRAIGLQGASDPPLSMTADLIVDLRNAMREELGFGSSLDYDRNKSWIATLTGAT